MNREDWLQAFAEKARDMFSDKGYTTPPVRIGVGWPAKGWRSKVLGECWSAEASGDGTPEIFIRASLGADPIDVADVLTHELVHATVGNDAHHGPEFRRCGAAAGLTGKATQMRGHESDVWREWALPVIEELGPFPGSSIEGLPAGQKKQSTRMIKVECDHGAGCGWTCRTTKKHIDSLGQIGDPGCPACGVGTLTWDLPNADDGEQDDD